MRRNSVTAEENITIKEETSNKKPKPERLFIRSASVGLAPTPEDGEKSPSPGPYTKTNQNRRESIKDHLMKFKAKAGKILDDVQNKSQDDQNASFFSQNSETEPKEELSVIDEQASESSSQQGTFRKESKEQLRNRIRKSAQQAVERTRGNVQLTRRLARRPTVVVEEQFDENDIQAIDEQVEKTIKMGDKFLSELGNETAKDKEIEDFIIGKTKEEKRAKKEEIRRVFYGRIEQNNYQHDLLVKYQETYKTIISEAEFEENQVSNKPFEKVDILDSTTSDCVFYAKAEKGQDVVERYNEKSCAQLDVFIDSIHIDHHYLWSDEEIAASQMRNAYFSHILKVHNMTQIESQHLEVDDEEKTLLYEEIRLGRLELERFAKKLENIRKEQGYITTNLKFIPSEVSWEDDWMKFGKIEETEIVTPISKVPNKERERLKLSRKTFIQIEIYYNSNFVSETPWLAISSHLIPAVYRVQLEIISPARDFNFVVKEKQGSVIREIGIGKIPWPSDADVDIALHEVVFMNSESREPMDPNMARDMKECGRVLCRAILENGKLKFWEASRKLSNSNSDETKKPKKFELIPSQLLIESKNHIDENKKRLEELREDDRELKKYSFQNAVDSKRMSSIQFANISRKRIMDRRSKMERKYEELVREQAIPTLSVAFSALFAQADDSRRLKPMRREGGTREEGWNSTIIVNIQSATNLPVRENGQLQSFVTISYSGNVITTGCAIGRHPNWQYTEKMVVENTEKRKEFIEIRVYDQIVEELDRDDRLQNVISEQYTSRLLATTKVRFSALTAVSKINAPLKLSVPAFLSSYKISNEPSYIKVLLSTQIQAEFKNDDCRTISQSNESSKILEKCAELENSLREQFPKRVFRPLVVDSNSKSSLCCRFLHPINPPAIIMQESVSSVLKIVSLAAQVVSSIPRTNASFHSDVWATCDQLTSVSVCGLVERAVLLSCWLMFFKLPITLIFGEAKGEQTAYILTEIESKSVIIDPGDGHIFNSITDSNCCLEKISGAFDTKNYYANIQEYDRTPHVNFNFAKTSNWRPLLPPTDDDLYTIQPTIIQYSYISQDWILELRIGLEREIKLQFDKERSHAIPQWNLAASRQLREILDASTGSDIEKEVDEKIARLRDSYKISVRVFRMPYVSIQDCVHEVLSTKLHETSDSSAQFALAVQLIDYFSHVIRVDIAIALLKPKK